MSFEQHLNALQSEMQQLHTLLHQHKEKIDEYKQDQKHKQQQMNTVWESYQNSQQDYIKAQKRIEKYNHFMAQYLGQIPQEAQMQISAEFEKIKQALQPPDAAQQQLAHNMMAGNMAMGGMPLPAMMALQAQAQAQMGRGIMPGMPAPSPRVQKSNGLHNGMPGLPPNMANGLTAQMAAMQNPMLGMPGGMAHLQAMAAFSAANMQAMGAMQGFNPAQLAAMQSMGLNSMMLPPMSAANSVAAAAALAAGGVVNPMGLSVSTPSRNPSNGGPLSGTRTPQSAPSNGVNSPRNVKEEIPEEKPKTEEVVRSPTDDTVAVA